MNFCLLFLSAIFAGVCAAAEPGLISGMSAAELRTAEAGKKLFLQEWQPAPGKNGARDGLGPFFHASSCAACHPGGGRAARAGTEIPAPGLLFRVGVTEDPLVDEYGAQLSPLAVPGVKPEGVVRTVWAEKSGAFTDGAAFSLRAPVYEAQDWNYGPPPADVRFSPRTAPDLRGSGLLEAVPAEAIHAMEDAEDKNGDGISGRANMEETWEGYHATKDVVGRFGWKAWMPTLLRQVCGALGEDMGLTNYFHPHDATPAEKEMLGDYASGNNGALFEVNSREVDELVAYVRFLAPPASRPLDSEARRRGETLFASTGCAACHVPELKTAGKSAALSGQSIHAFTDLLLHDMGEALADHRTEARADGREWRTAPLWGLADAVDADGRGPLLHDGRARSIAEAILWHGGEAEKSRNAFQALPAADRAALLLWLRSL